MSIFRPCLCNRYEPMRALDFPPGIDVISAVDRALGDVSENVEGHLHRVFYPSDDTRYFDWPNQGASGGGQYANPWRYWLDENDLVALTNLVSGGVTLPLNQVFLRPYDNPRKFRPYYTFIELDRSYNVQFGNNAQTPQLSIAMTGTWGYGADADPAGTLAADVGDSDDTITVSDGSKAGPGDLVILGYGRGSAPFPGSDPHAGAIAPYVGERVLITDVAAVETGLTQSGAGCTTDSDADNALSTTGSGALNPGEVVILDQENMLVEQVVAGVATMRRAFNGTMLASHSGAAVYALRQWSVLRAQLGTIAVTASQGDPVSRHRVPSLVRSLAIAEVENTLLQEGTGYARTVGSGDAVRAAPGIGLADKWAECRTRHGRKARHRGV